MRAVILGGGSPAVCLIASSCEMLEAIDISIREHVGKVVVLGEPSAEILHLMTDVEILAIAERFNAEALERGITLERIIPNLQGYECYTPKEARQEYGPSKNKVLNLNTKQHGKSNCYFRASGFRKVPRSRKNNRWATRNTARLNAAVRG
jgi:hypothetical protein